MFTFSRACESFGGKRIDAIDHVSVSETTYTNWLVV